MAIIETTLIYQSPLGEIIVGCEDGALTSLRFAREWDGLWGGKPQDPIAGTAASQLADPQAQRPTDPSVLRWLDLYFSGQKPSFTPPLRLDGTAFQQRVWQALLQVPYGQTVSYAELARRVGCPSAQAVGGAVGRNPVALVVPCHRVVGSNGSLTGYAYGLGRKQWLLDLEKRS